VALTPGTNAQAYADAVGTRLGQNYSVSTNGSSTAQFVAIIGLIATLTLLLAAVAGLGVLNTVVLQTWKQRTLADLGVTIAGKLVFVCDDFGGAQSSKWS
jgi:putative ABC transport system permease protein